MPYQLPEELSYCHVDGCLIFLDLDRDRYFRLPHYLEVEFLACLRGVEQAGVGLENLVRRKILTRDSGTQRQLNAPPIPAPSCSALEHRPSGHVSDTTGFLQVLAAVCLTRWQLETRRLRDVIASCVRYRQLNATCPPSGSNGLSERMLQSANIFRRWRPYVPVETRCLLDSLAMVRFLAGRSLSADIVFGVTHHPFAAHCWVQAGEWVLNDTVGNVAAHTPIRQV